MRFRSPISALTARGRSRLAAGALMLCAAACGDHAVVPDARTDADPDYRQPVLISIEVESPDGAIVRIAGQQRYVYETTVANEAALATTVIEVENLLNGQVASSLIAGVDCDQVCTEAYYSRVAVFLVAYASGEIRHASTSCGDIDAHCTADSFGDPRCSPMLGCGQGEKCGIAHVSFDPSHGWLDCMQPGARQLGETCSIDANGIDDCDDGLHCYQGTCHMACYCRSEMGQCATPNGCPSTEVCVHVDGMSPDVGVCQP